MLSIQALEEMDYELGCASELQNAFDRSRMEIQIHDDTKKIEELVAASKHVVASSGVVCCPSTDAYIGRSVHIEGIFDTREEAMALFAELGPGDGDVDCWVMPIVQPEPRPISEVAEIFLADDCPF